MTQLLPCNLSELCGCRSQAGGTGRSRSGTWPTGGPSTQTTPSAGPSGPWQPSPLQKVSFDLQVLVQGQAVGSWLPIPFGALLKAWPQALPLAADLVYTTVCVVSCVVSKAPTSPAGDLVMQTVFHQFEIRSSNCPAGAEPLLAVACDDGSARVFRVEGSTPGLAFVRALPPTEGRVLCCAWGLGPEGTPQGASLVTGTSRGTVHVWDVAGLRETLRITTGVLALFL